MSSVENVLWSLFCNRSEETIDDLSFYQVKLLLKALPPEDLKNWLVWYEGANDWRAVEAVQHHFLISKKANPVATASGPVLAPASHGSSPKAYEPKREIELDDTIADLELDSDEKSERRPSRRVTKRLEVSIHTAKGIFKTHTENISLTGLMVADPLPSGLKSPIEVEIHSARHGTLKVQCALLTEDKANQSRRLRILKTASLDHLRSLILS